MSLDPLAILAILFGLQAKHFLFDFVFQSDWQVRNKGIYGHPGGIAHAGLHGVGTLVVLGLCSAFGVLSLPLAAALAIADFAIHYHVDWAKARIARKLYLTPERSGFWVALGADQAAHQATYLLLLVVLIAAL
ncbi:MAG: DUF3307 domain-containing protein [Pseudomonadota bacterium]